MVYQVPQFIEEDVKLMGLITFTQLWILLSFFGIALLFFLILPFWLAIIFAIIFFAAGSFIALGKVNGVPVYKLVLAAIRHFWLPKYYLWKKARTASSYFPQEKAISGYAPLQEKSSAGITETPPAPLPPQKNLTPEKLEKLANLLD